VARQQSVPTITESPEHWLARAKQVREAAILIGNPDARQAMLEIAENYEKMAKRAEAQEAGVKLLANARQEQDDG
jgi:hypothetical protein